MKTSIEEKLEKQGKQNVKALISCAYAFFFLYIL